MDKSEPILLEIKNAVLGIEPNAEVVLFGSRARGDYHEESDWDVLVLTNKDEKDFEFRSKVRKVILGLELEFGQAITGLVRNREFWGRMKATPLFREVQKDGLVL